MYTNKEILEIAMSQSAIDINCAKEDFLKKQNVIVEGILGKTARRYYQEPIACNLVSYGNNIVASTKNEYREIVKDYINKFSIYHCFETPNIHYLDEKMAPYSQKTCFMALYFLPDVNKLGKSSCKYNLKILNKQELANIPISEFSNALTENNRDVDILGIGAYDNDKLIGLAACSVDCDLMWQIGVDVLSDYRNQGIASTLTTNLAIEILNQNKIPFYCCAWSNLASQRNAIKSGFYPAWVELTVKPIELIEEFNK